MTAPKLSFARYPDKSQSFDTLVTIMVGDFQRIIEYPKRGLQTEQGIPPRVHKAWENLIALGYDNHLIK